MNTCHGDTETRSSLGLLSKALTESIIDSAGEVHSLLELGLRSMTSKKLRVSVSQWSVFCG